ncbi:type II toxin-antitoxin system HicB family antitoxin [Candidatus Daviesbacteria bacterium]|nr:type II toxin-antitoxin system HicB family antitoxin [Candidatus Daviesbacteria bacterium]
MQKQILNYRIIIEPEKIGKKIVYNAYCPTLGLADYGDTIDEAFKNIQSLVKFHIESLLKDGLEVPSENTEEEVITSTKVSINSAGENYQVVVG